ncbi:MAG: HAD family hydrolase [Anaerolineae bacterium]|nr:HAD family hydrolase [Anaerolineae bacterium]
MPNAIFIDKDGTLIHDVPYNVNPALIELSPGAGRVLRQWHDVGYLLVVISNQSGIAKGMFDEAALIPVRNQLNRLLRRFGVALDGFYYCPHWPEGTVAPYAVDCDCRKPKPGMLLQAAHDLNIDLRHSWMIGDIAADHEAGQAAGCRTILIEKPYDPLPDFAARNRPDGIVTDWDAVGRLILRESGRHEY